MRYGLDTFLPINAFQKRCGKLATLEGGGGFLGLGPAPSAPAAPDYSGAARETAAGNLEATRAAAAANRVNQVTPYGNLTYTTDGTDPYGNLNYTATTSLTDAGQRILDQQNKLGEGLFSSQDKSLDYINKQLENPLDTSKLASVGINPGENYQDAIMRRLQPRQERQQAQLETQLSNQGIPRDSEAWRNAMTDLTQQQNDAANSAVVQGFNTGLAARQQGLQEAGYLRNEPINTLASLRTGSQVTNPTFQNVAQQATTSGPDLLGAANMQQNAAMGAFNAQQAAQGSANSGLTSLAGAGLMAFSDITTKENIVHIGHYGGLPVYEWEYKAQYRDHPLAGHGKFVGFMAHEVQELFPHAVVDIDGIKAINYGFLQ
jgi:hypothetical protein